MIVSNLKALEGLVWGTAFGDAWVRMHRYRKPPFLLHSATGTWFLAQFQALFEPGDLALKLQLLATPSAGAALRSGVQGLGVTLREVFKTHPTQKLLADVLPAMTPFVFCSDLQGGIQKLIAAVQVTHRHPRVICSVALLIGSLQALLEEPSLSLEAQLEAGEKLADAVLHRLFENKEADTPQAIWTAHQALKHHVALGKGAVDAMDLQVPVGFDGRDSPEQLVVYALATARDDQMPEKVLRVILEQAGTSDILAPLVMGLVGFKQGMQAFPESWRQMLMGREIWSRHLYVLASRDPYFPSLAEAEIRLSVAEERAFKELNQLERHNYVQNQLSLFEDQGV